MLYGKILRSPHPHARILHVDTSQAESLPGVKAIITGKETAGMRFAFLDTPRYPADQYPLAQHKVRYVGDEVAAVAAIDEDIAAEALELIRVEYEILPAVFDPFQAMKPDAPRVHDEEYAGTSIWEEWGARRTRTSEAYYELNNISGRTSVSFGDIERGFAQSDHIREDRFETAPTSHCALEPHACVASYDATGTMHVWFTNQGIFYKRYILARVLGMPVSKVRVHKSYVGGAFGGKQDLYPFEICACLLSRKSGKPVKIELTREEVFTTTRQRHPTFIELKTGVKRDGTLLAQDIRVIVDNGAYRGTGPVVIYLFYGWTIPVYRVPNLSYEGYSVYTNNPVGGPQRGHGAPQIRFAIDSQLDMIAEDLGLDSVEIMLKNAREVGEVLPNGDRLDSCGLKDAISKAVQVSGWRGKRGRPGSDRAADLRRGEVRRGVGISTAAMFSGSAFYPFASAAVIKMHDDGGATLFTGSVEMGQGSETTLSQIAAEELGLRLEDIRLVSADTELAPVDMGSFLSGGAFVTGDAVRLAAADAKRQLLEVASDQLDAAVEELEVREGRIFHRGRPEWGMSVAEAVQTSIRKNGGNPVIGRGYRPNVPGVDRHPSLAKAKGRWTDAYGYAAQVAEVEVDTATGIVKLVKATTYHDCGFPLNPMIVEGQVHGCVSMGQGQALSEELILEGGQVLNPSFMDYRLPISLDTPQTEGGPVDSIEPKGPFGAKEVGEGVVAQTLAAIANAVYDAVGVRVTSLPITPEKILNGLGVLEER